MKLNFFLKRDKNPETAPAPLNEQTDLKIDRNLARNDRRTTIERRSTGHSNYNGVSRRLTIDRREAFSESSPVVVH